jgi:hypothetical protein
MLSYILKFYEGTAMRSWDKLKHESYEQFDCFTDFRDNKELRALEKLALCKNKGIKQISNWAEKFDWDKRANDFDEITKDNDTQPIEKQLSKLGEKQANQIIEVAGSLDDMANAIKEKMQISSEKIDEKKLEALLKLISSYMKSMTEIQKIFQMLRSIPYDQSQKDEKFPFEKIIINDEKSFELASKLLSRINEVREDNLVNADY